MKSFFCFLLLPAVLLAHPGRAQAPGSSAERLLVAHPSVGEVIDKAEKAHYGLFMYYSADEFAEARFYRSLSTDSAITLRAQVRGSQQARPFTQAEFMAVRESIERRNRELGLPKTPVAAVAPGTAPAVALTQPSSNTPEILGRSYTVELVSGTSFIGVLQSATETELEFQTKDLGTVRIQRTSLKQIVMLTAEQAVKGYEDVGNGTRMFIAPTARNLRRGEGYVQNVSIVLMGVNYGVTDNFSIGTMFTFIPDAGSDNLFAITPKLSFPVSPKARLGGGVLMFFIDGTVAGLTYANATYGSADHNVTGGLGYAFVGGNYASTPVFMLGGATRVSRRLSLLNESYIVRDSDSYGTSTVVAGIAGLRVSAQRLSGSWGMAYAYASRSESGMGPGYEQSNFNIIPFYVEVAYRFGKIKTIVK